LQNVKETELKSNFISFLCFHYHLIFLSS